MILARIALPLLLFFAAAANAASIRLPDPQGRYAPGYWAGSMVTRQDDELSTSAGDKRRLGLSIWFPSDAAAQGRPKPWASRMMGQALSNAFPFPPGFEADVVGHSEEGVTPVQGPLPVVIFSHGLSFPHALYQSFFEDLASRGYAVLAVSHPHGASLIEYPDGNTATMDAWPRQESEEARQAFLAGHAAVWVQDLREVLDWIQAGAPNSPLAGRLDPGRIAVLGHSYGGTAAGRLTHDPRIKAAIAMEGAVRDPSHVEARGTLTVGAPLLHLIGGYNRLEHEGAQYLPAEAAPVFQAVINGTGHAYFSDLIYLYQHHADAEWHQRHRYGVAPGRVLQISRDYIAAFLDRYLNGAEANVLLKPKSAADRTASPSRGGYPEVELSISVR